MPLSTLPILKIAVTDPFLSYGYWSRHRSGKSANIVTPLVPYLMPSHYRRILCSFRGALSFLCLQAEFNPLLLQFAARWGLQGLSLSVIDWKKMVFLTKTQPIPGGQLHQITSRDKCEYIISQKSSLSPSSNLLVKTSKHRLLFVSSLFLFIVAYSYSLSMCKLCKFNVKTT